MAFEGLTAKLNAAFKKLRGKGRLSESDIKEAMREIRLALLEADVSYKVVKDFVKSVSERCSGQDVMESLTPAQTIVKIVNEELIRLMGSENQRISISPKPPTVVMLVGLQGAGKTTNGAKLAGLFKKQGKRPLLVACDIYRPAAIKQLEVVGGQLGIPVFQMGQENPVKIAKATGQDAVNAAQSFNEWLDIDGVMLTKLDGDARGGAALSVKAVTGKSIKFIGTGEKLDMIEPFHPERMASRILGMGDVLTLIEKAEQALDQKKAAELEQKMRANKFTLADFYDQLLQIRKMGPMQDLLGMIPGMGSMKNVQVDESALGRVEAIILSMTPYERENPACLNSSRKRRIALGCGQKVEDVNRLLKQFDQMQQLMKQMNGKGKKRKLPGKMGGFPGFPGM